MQDAQPDSSKNQADDFLRLAETLFLQMQRLWDAGDMEKISKLVSPRLLKQLKRDLTARGDRTNHTEVVQLRFELTSGFNDKIGSTVSVKFFGEMREEVDAEAGRFEDIWHFCRIDDGDNAWQIDSIRIVV